VGLVFFVKDDPEHPIGPIGLAPQTNPKLELAVVQTVTT
jgi:hypothetical protein